MSSEIRQSYYRQGLCSTSLLMGMWSKVPETVTITEPSANCVVLSYAYTPMVQFRLETRQSKRLANDKIRTLYSML